MKVLYYKNLVIVYVKKNLKYIKNKRIIDGCVFATILNNSSTFLIISDSKTIFNQTLCNNFVNNWCNSIKYKIYKSEKLEKDFKIFKFIDKHKSLNDLCISFQSELKTYRHKITVQCIRLVGFKDGYKHFVKQNMKPEKQSSTPKVRNKRTVRKKMKLINIFNPNHPMSMLFNELTNFLIFLSEKKFFLIYMSKFCNLKKQSYLMCNGTNLIVFKKKKFLISTPYTSLSNKQQTFLISELNTKSNYKNWYSSKAIISYSKYKYYKKLSVKKNLIPNKLNFKSSEENIKTFKNLYFNFNSFFKFPKHLYPEKFTLSSHISVSFSKFFFFEYQTLFVWRLTNLTRFFVLSFQNFKLKKDLNSCNLNMFFTCISRNKSFLFFSITNKKQNQRNFIVVLLILIKKMYILKKFYFLNVFIFRQFSYLILASGYFFVHPRTLSVRFYISALLKYWIRTPRLTKILSTLKFN